MAILNLDALPTDSVERIMFLDSVEAQVQRELDEQYRQAYFDARLEGRLDAALGVGRASRKQALRWTRQANEAVGRVVRWGDGY